MIKRVLRVLLKHHPHPDALWRQRILYTAKKLEARLYFTSASLEEHLNKATIPSRMQRVAKEVITARARAEATPTPTAEVAEENQLLSLLVPTTDASHDPPTAASPPPDNR